MKHPNEANQINNPNYCTYHHLVSHPVEKYFVFKDKILKLQKDEKLLISVKNTCFKHSILLHLTKGVFFPFISIFVFSFVFCILVYYCMNKRPFT